MDNVNRILGKLRVESRYAIDLSNSNIGKRAVARSALYLECKLRQFRLYKRLTLHIFIFIAANQSDDVLLEVSKLRNGKKGRMRKKDEVKLTLS